jgi:peroxiredoxin
LRLALAGLLLLVAALAFLAWRSQLFTVSRPGLRPLALEVRAAAARAPVHLDAALVAVPVGMRRLRDGEGVLIIHYWAMWERHGRSQAAALDSLARLKESSGLRAVAVCFDPMPSVARFVGRNRLRLPVLLDGDHRLSRVLPCPSIPYTYVLDRRGRVAVAQAGEVDWLGPRTRATLHDLLREDGPAAGE